MADTSHLIRLGMRTAAVQQSVADRPGRACLESKHHEGCSMLFLLYPFVRFLRLSRCIVAELNFADLPEGMAKIGQTLQTPLRADC